jgi:hypothetical protein
MKRGSIISTTQRGNEDSDGEMIIPALKCLILKVSANQHKLDVTRGFESARNIKREVRDSVTPGFEAP